MPDMRPMTYRDVPKLYDLRTTKAQEGFVAPNGITMGQSAVEAGSEVFGIWEGDEAVGLIAIVDMTHPEADLDEGDDPDGIYVWRLMVSDKVQGRGFGRAAMEFAIDLAAERGRKYVCLSCVDEPGSAIGFYEKLGFTRTGRVDGDEEHEMVRYF